MPTKVSYEDAQEHAKLWDRDRLKMFEACERILEAWGEVENFTVVCGHCGVQALQYEDDSIRIARRTNSPMMEVYIKKGVTENGGANPIFSRWSDGRIIRTHGEWIFIAKHVWDLFEGLE